MKHTKLTIALLVILSSVVLTSAYAQVNGTSTNSTGTNSTITNSTVIEEIITPIVNQNPTNASINLTGQSHLQGAMLTIAGNGIDKNAEVNVTIYHPNGSKFGIFKTVSTSSGNFQLLVELVPTSLQGEYTIKAIVKDITLTKKFVYSGGSNLSSNEITDVVNASPVAAAVSSPVSTPTPSSSSSTNTSTGTNWDAYIQGLNPQDRLDLIHAVIKYLLS